MIEERIKEIFLGAEEARRLKLVNTLSGQVAILEEGHRVVYGRDGFEVRGRVDVLGYAQSIEAIPLLLPVGVLLKVCPVGEGLMERQGVYKAVEALGHGYGETFPICFQ